MWVIFRSIKASINGYWVKYSSVDNSMARLGPRSRDRVLRVEHNEVNIINRWQFLIIILNSPLNYLLNLRKAEGTGSRY
jgi:hypothetical protein